MGLPRTVSMMNSDFSRVFCAPAADGVVLGIGYRRSGSKNQNNGAIRRRKKFDDIFSRLNTIYERDRQTDGRTPDDIKDRAYA